MPNVYDILHYINELSDEDKRKLQAMLMSGDFVGALNLHEFVERERFANGRVCPLCGSVHVVRNGHRADGTQRFLCRD